MNKGAKIALILTGFVAVGTAGYFVYRYFANSADDSQRLSESDGKGVKAGDGKISIGAKGRENAANSPQISIGLKGRENAKASSGPSVSQSVQDIAKLEGKLIKGRGVQTAKQASYVNNNFDYQGAIPAGIVIGTATGETKMAQGVSQMETLVQVTMRPGVRDVAGKTNAFPKTVWVNRNYVTIL